MPEQSGIYFTDSGKGLPVLFIHGFCETHWIWNKFSDELSNDFRVLMIDLPGFGQSKSLSAPFSITDVSQEIIGLLKKLQIEQCICIGHSLGGYVTLAMIEQAPEIVKAFGLFHSTAYPDTEERKVLRNKVIEFVTRNGVSAYTDSFMPSLFYNQDNAAITEVVRLAGQTKPETLINYVEAMRDRPDRSDIIQDFKGSILLIAGEKDAGISVESVRSQAKLNQSVELHVLPEVAHMGMFEMENKALQFVKRFLLGQTAYLGL
jgi:pimeloyl-ACP methyl ester carboxylesterase